MSRIGKLPIIVPNGVKIEEKGRNVSVTGPKGTNEFLMPRRVKLELQDGIARIDRIGNDRVSRSNHGLARTLLNNAVVGVSEGYTRKLEMSGVGYRVEQSGKLLTFTVGYSHPIRYMLPERTDAEVDIKTNVITLTSSSKWEIGQVAAIIRSFRPPEPYKGKGIKYAEEKIRRKVGKTA